MFGIGHKRRPGKITKLDVLLADALRMYEDSLCKGCGTPTAWAWDLRGGQYFALDPESPICAVCELLESRQRDPEETPQAGQKTRVINRHFDAEGGS